MTTETKKSRGLLGTIFGPAIAAVTGGFGAMAGLYAEGKMSGRSFGLLDYAKVGFANWFSSGVDNLVSGGTHGGWREGMEGGATAGFFAPMARDKDGKMKGVSLTNAFGSSVAAGFEDRAVSGLGNTLRKAMRTGLGMQPAMA